jgi:hypothetical protein
MADWGMIVGDRRAWVRDIAFTATTALVLAFLAPFGMDRVPLQQRIVEFFTLGFASFIMLWPPMRAALRLGTRAGLPEPFVLIGGIAVLTLPVTLVCIQVVRVFGPIPPPQTGSDLIRVYFMILAMTLPFGAAYMTIERRLLDRPAPAPAQPPPPSKPPAAEAPRLVSRLQPRLGGRVLALQGEDHYVRVHTALGSELLLMRLGDAIDELDGMEGERVHRSWWVARAAVDAVTSSGRRLSLTLANGIEVPVTREAGPRLRRAGWLERA